MNSIAGKRIINPITIPHQVMIFGKYLLIKALRPSHIKTAEKIMSNSP
jgi:hypothetical protein